MASRHYIDFELLDYSESKSSFSVYNGAITALSLPGFLTQLGALRTALAGIVIGTIRRERWVGDETILSNVPPSNPNAQRELKWMIHFETVAGDEEYAEATIAAPDTTLLQANSDEIDYVNADVAAFITAFEAIARVHDNDVDAVVVTRMFLVGRKL